MTTMWDVDHRPSVPAEHISDVYWCPHWLLWVSNHVIFFLCLSVYKAQRRLWEAVKRYKTSGRSRNKVWQICWSHYFVWTTQQSTLIYLSIHSGVEQSKCRCGALGRRSPQYGGGSGHPGTSQPNSRQRAGSWREIRIWFLRGGEEGRLVHTHRDCSKRCFKAF